MFLSTFFQKTEQTAPHKHLPPTSSSPPLKGSDFFSSPPQTPPNPIPYIPSSFSILHIKQSICKTHFLNLTSSIFLLLLDLTYIFIQSVTMMSFGNLNELPIKKIESVTVSFCSPLSFIILGLSMHIIPLCLQIINEFFSKPDSFFQSQTDPLNNSEVLAEKKKINNDFELSKQLSSTREKQQQQQQQLENGSLRREDAEMVMERLGILCHLEGEKLQERFGSDDLSDLFAEKEPSLDEVKETFDVFDENRDGFIDAMELQRVLCVLGFKEGSELHSCRNMINAYDENGDGRIDFSEFVKFMENSFC